MCLDLHTLHILHYTHPTTILRYINNSYAVVHVCGVIFKVSSFVKADVFLWTFLITMTHVWQIWKECVWHIWEYVILPLSCLQNQRSASLLSLNNSFSTSLKNRWGRESHLREVSLFQIHSLRNSTVYFNTLFCMHQWRGTFFHDAVCAESCFCYCVCAFWYNSVFPVLPVCVVVKGSWWCENWQSVFLSAACGFESSQTDWNLNTTGCVL